MLCFVLPSFHRSLVHNLLTFKRYFCFFRSKHYKQFSFTQSSVLIVLLFLTSFFFMALCLFIVDSVYKLKVNQTLKIMAHKSWFFALFKKGIEYIIFLIMKQNTKFINFGNIVLASAGRCVSISLKKAISVDLQLHVTIDHRHLGRQCSKTVTPDNIKPLTFMLCEKKHEWICSNTFTSLKIPLLVRATNVHECQTTLIMQASFHKV